MTGNRLALTERDKAVLGEVDRLGAVTREQLMRLRFFSSKTRANERLRKLTRAGYLTARRQPLSVGGPRLVYLPGPLMSEGRNARTRLSRASDLFLSHQLGLGDIRLAFEQHTALASWVPEKDLADLSLGLIPDAYVEYAVGDLTYCAFVEYDRGTETLGRFGRKVLRYVDLARSGRFERTIRRRFFRVLDFTDSDGRLGTLSHAIARTTDQIFWLVTKAALLSQGPLASIWRRPRGHQSESLT